MQLLVSVRSVDEALVAACHGADLIDLKEPRAGALGALPQAEIRTIARALRDAGIALEVSATIGDGPMARAEMLDRVAQTAACGVDLVKVGIGWECDPPQTIASLDALAGCDAAVVPVFIADRGIDFALVDHAARLRFPALMIDTADKRAGSLFDAVPHADLQRFVQGARGAGRRVGVAGALQPSHAHALQDLAPDFAGFRSAVCTSSREGAIDARRLRELRNLLRREAVASAS